MSTGSLISADGTGGQVPGPYRLSLTALTQRRGMAVYCYYKAAENKKHVLVRLLFTSHTHPPCIELSHFISFTIVLWLPYTIIMHLHHKMNQYVVEYTHCYSTTTSPTSWWLPSYIFNTDISITTMINKWTVTSVPVYYMCNTVYIFRTVGAGGASMLFSLYIFMYMYV